VDTVSRLKDWELKISRYSGARIHDARHCLGAIRIKLILIEEQGLTPELNARSLSTIIDCENFEKETNLGNTLDRGGKM
jgi:hypothetical protein